MKKLTFTSVFSQLLLLLFVIAWIVPTFGLFISSLRDKDVLAISGWWTSFTTTEVNEIYRTKGKEDQIKEGDYYFIKSNLFDENQGKEIYRLRYEDLRFYFEHTGSSIHCVYILSLIHI